MSAELSARSVSHAEGVDPVRALQRVLYRSAKQNPTRRFHALYDKVARSDVLWRAWVEVAKNQGAPGVDGMSIASISADGTNGVQGVPRRPRRSSSGQDVSPEAAAAGPHPQTGQAGRNPAARHPNGGRPGGHDGGQARPRTNLRGRFLSVSFGFRPKRSAHQALEEIRVTANRGNWVLDADIKACFDEIDHEALMAQVERRVVDRQMLKLLRVGCGQGCSRAGWSLTPSRGLRRVHRFPHCWPTSPSTSSTRRGRGGRPGDAGPLCRRFRRALPPAGAGPKRLSAGSKRAGRTRAAPASRQDPHRLLGDGTDGFDFLGFIHRKTLSKFGDRRYLSKWPSPGPWPQSGPRSVTTPTAASQAVSCQCCR